MNKENNSQLSIVNYKLAIIGLGYVGLPLAHAFSSKYEVVGFDISKWRIDELSSGYDRTLELSSEQVNEAIKNGMKFTLDTNDIKDCNIYIVTVPTPIDKNKRPDLTPLIKASETVGNGALTYPIGLMTADEIAFAGGVAFQTMNTPYAWFISNSVGTQVSSFWWSLSPNYWYYGFAFVWRWNPVNAYLVNDEVDYISAVRPAISLKSCTLYSTGDGSASNPYTIQETESGC